MAGNKMKIDGADLAALRRRRGMGKEKHRVDQKAFGSNFVSQSFEIGPGHKVHKRNKRSTTKVKALTTPTKRTRSSSDRATTSFSKKKI